jgi:2-amino-4-hydroxy-6-hydroxymethyldihydropteridine diphosphokinase
VGTSTYLIAIGSNRRTKWGLPQATILSLFRGFVASCESSDRTQSHKATKAGGGMIALSRIVTSRPVGPGTRRYANAVALIESDLTPEKLLRKLKKIECTAGRRPGRRWGDRPLDLDIIGWSGGIWASKALTIPHPEFRARRFVLAPLCEIAPDWRDPVTHLTARQLLARLDRNRPRA